MASPNVEVETPLSEKIVPARGAAQKAAASLKDYTQKRSRGPSTLIEKALRTLAGGDSTESDLTDIDTDVEDEPPMKRRGPGRPRGSTTRGRVRGRAASSRGNVEGRIITYKSGRRSLRGVPSPSASSSRSPSPLPGPSDILRTPQKRSLYSSDTPSKRRKLTAGRKPQPSTSIDLAASLVLASSSSRSPSKFPNVFSKQDVIWVRVDSEGVSLGHEMQDDHLSYWWPAQVTGDDPLVVLAKLFGDGNRQCIEIDSPSTSIVLPFRRDGMVQFSSTTFASTHAEDGGQVQGAEISSEVLARWTTAFNQALVADVNDELPDVDLLISQAGTEVWRGKQKERDNGPLNVMQTPSPKRPKKFSVDPLDDQIKVGLDDGELVLAKDHKDRLDHWPARVIGVSQKKNGKWLYEIRYIDGKRRRLERHQFFSSDEDGFATCQLGEWKTQVAASDTEAPDSADELRLCRHDTRSPSPSNPELDDIKDFRDFQKLSVEKQMHYVYPFLCRVINREYEPSFHRHDAFMKGGKAREQLGQSASTRGHFSDNEMRKVSTFVRRKMLRDERWAERVDDGDEVRAGESNAAPLGSDETKVDETATGNGPEVLDVLPGADKSGLTLNHQTPSPDMDAAMALTELKSSDVFPISHDSFTTCHSDDQAIFAEVGVGSSLTTEISTAATLAPPSSFTQHSDLELDSDDEHAPASPPTNASVLVVNKTTGVTALRPGETPVGAVSPLHSSVKSRKRPVGCKDYETMSRSERCLYCADVLLPEAVIQLHLFRDGRRKSMRLLTLTEEMALYEQGQKLVMTNSPNNWIQQIVQLRKLAESAYKKRTHTKDDVKLEIIGGTSTRPKARKVF